MAIQGKDLNNFIKTKVWDQGTSATGGLKAALITFLRLLYVMVQGFSDPQLTMRSMSLVYTTLLSLVPLLAVSFSALKAFGIHNQIQPLLHNFLAPLGVKGEEITLRIISFVENMKVGVLGSLGLIILIYTVISVIQKVEAAFNYTWKVKTTRHFIRRFNDYISIVIIGPVLIFSALGVTASVMNTAIVQKILLIKPFGTVIYLTGRVIPYALVCLAFTFLYFLIPNTKVRFQSALTGGIFAGILWETAGWIFASFIATSTKYVAVYSSFAILIVFMIWIYLSWLILLVGSRISFSFQYPHYSTAGKTEFSLSNRLKERLALVILFLISDHYYKGKSRWTLNALINQFGLPLEAIHSVLDILKDKGFIIETSDDPLTYVPARDIETISLGELYTAVRTSGEDVSPLEKKFSNKTIETLIEGINDAINNELGEKTVKSLIQSVHNT